MDIAQHDPTASGRPTWNAGRNVGVKKPLNQLQIWAIGFFLDRERRIRDRALFDLPIDSKYRGRDLAKIEIGALVTRTEFRARAMVTQQKTGRPVQFETTADVRARLIAWLQRRGVMVEDYAFPSRVNLTGLVLRRDELEDPDDVMSFAAKKASAIGLEPMALSMA